MLKGIFGLHPRILEDVVADLLRRGRVSLNLEAGEVRITESPALGRARQIGREMFIWQDEHTGAILPWDLVKHFLTPPREWQDLPTNLKWSFPPFPNLSVGHVLAALQPLAKGLRGETDGLIVDSLLERTFQETAELYLTLAELEIDGAKLIFVDCPELPAWLVAEWTRQLGSSSQAGGADNSLISSARGLLVARRSPTSRQNLFLEADIANASREWFSHFKAGLSHVEEPGNPMHEAERAQDILHGYLRAAGRIELRNTSGTNHLAELWRRAKFSLVIAGPDWNPELLQRVLAETVLGAGDHDAHLILLDGSADSRKQGRKSPLDGVRPERQEAGEVHTAVLSESISGTYCLIDGRILRWGTLDTLLSLSAPLVEITGTSGISAISAAISARLPGEGRWWIDQQLVPNDLPNPETNESDRKSADFRAELQVLMLEATEEIALADHARKVGVRPSARLGGEQPALADRGTTEVDSALADSQNTVRRHLIEAANSLMQRLSDATFECPVAIRSPFETLAEICRFAENHPSKLTLTIIVSSIPADMPAEWAGLFGALTSASNPVNVCICLAHPASNKSIERLQKTFPALLGKPVFSHSRSLLKLPNVVMLTGGEGGQRIAAVAISDGNWFSDRSQAPGIFFHSRELCDKLLTTIRDAAPQTGG
jgi:hypothetical protein